MQALIELLTNQLNIDSAQAEGCLGAIAKLAQDKLGSADFSQLTDAIPDFDTLAANSPEAESGALGGLFGSAMSAFGGEGAGNIAQLVGMFDKVGLDADMVTKFAPIVMQFVEEQGGEGAMGLLKKLF
ncbi:MAG: DUF2780 domain-containing protein [Glaciecola sp.]|nr:DUF2780 domain-containing protein [Glaciecola sp.]MDG1815651.1 DUF2780 domain-containing protein [Glaciecola sp.]MDG2098170.1 DUF2780 domain-containing protein [Glaciecola sp.]